MTKRELQESRDAKAVEAQQSLTAGDREKFDKIMADVKTIDADLARFNSLEALNVDLRSTQQPQMAPVGKTGNRERKVIRSVDRSMTEEERWGIHEYLMKAENRVDPLDLAEVRDLGITTSTLGGYFVPQGFVYDIMVALKAVGPLIENVTELPTATGQPLPYPTSIDTSGTPATWNMATVLGEGQPATELDMAIGHIMLGAWKYSTGLVLVSLELLQDSAFNIEDYLKAQFALRLARGWTNDLTNGTGSANGYPYGLLNAATASGQTVVGAKPNSGNSNDTGANSLGTDDFINLIYSVDPLYRIGAKFVMHDTTIASLARMKDTFGRPLWAPKDANTAVPNEIFGYPIVYDQYMPVIAASANTVLFGDLKKYIMRRVKELSVLVLRERYAEKGQVGFVGFARMDGNLIDAGSHPVKYLTQAAD